ncbi:3-oxoacyl-[acyl-carrier-protein] synthase III C-terminal domain-containing protein [Rothia dentocariosa]|uniref:3-oxoacyl-[acyl-carrier-protein] synthase III C-terminal domain-containing protein n=1 Tax=Rothia dentocariosa TaxID=2047 RepID=UPI00195EF1FC|nr:3-oxoacyl-[acyl-carrier-protein] synthase III C-terminal domain-containing protein [Rothia dentocariosa]VTY07458.1 Uncharacterised protein [Rothia dentocariosa]
MAGIVSVGVHHPSTYSLADLQQLLEISDADIRRFQRAFGFEKIAMAPEASEADLLVPSIENIPNFNSIRSQIKWVIRARTVRHDEPWPSNPLEEVCRRTGLEQAKRMTITDYACASGLYCIDLATRLLNREDENGLILVLTGEKAMTRESRMIPGVALLGEATAAVVVGKKVNRYKLLGFAALQHPVPGSGLTMNTEASEYFAKVYADNLDQVVQAALSAADITTEQVTAYLPHNVSRMLSIRTARRWGLTKDQVLPGTIAQVGHCWSADPFLNIHDSAIQEQLNAGDKFILTSVGIGATYSAMVVEC